MWAVIGGTVSETSSVWKFVDAVRRTQTTVIVCECRLFTLWIRIWAYALVEISLGAQVRIYGRRDRQPATLVQRGALTMRVTMSVAAPGMEVEWLRYGVLLLQSFVVLLREEDFFSPILHGRI